MNPEGQPADSQHGDRLFQFVVLLTQRTPVIDDWGALREQYNELEEPITMLAVRGLPFGIHVVLTADRAARAGVELRDTVGTLLELRLGDPSLSEAARWTAAK